MPVEMRLEDAGTAPGPERAEPRESARAAGTGPAVLRDLIAARLVTHEAIGDPARLGPEPAALRALCGLVAGPVYRLEPFHYAFAARETDLGGALAGRAPGERTAALGAALAAALGPEAVWLGAIDLATEAPETAPETAALDRRLAAIEARLEALLDAQSEIRAAVAPGREIQLLEIQAREIQAREARGFEARLGLALAEFLARLERREGVAAPVA